MAENETQEPEQPVAAAPDAEKPAEKPAEKKPPLLEPGEYAQYILRSKAEVLFVLRSLLDAVSQVTIFFNEGKEMLLTTLVALEDDAVVLDFGASSETNRKAQEAEKLFCVAVHEKVRIQFLLRGLKRIEYKGRPAFRAALPDEVLRLQRREFFRLTTPIARPLKCLIPFGDSEGTVQMMDMNVVDISGGGLALALPEGVTFETGAEFPNCKVDLLEVGTVTATLKIRNQFEITLRSGGRVRRAGCEFIKIAPAMLNLVQRYIIKVERERKARESGMI